MSLVEQGYGLSHQPSQAGTLRLLSKLSFSCKRSPTISHFTSSSQLHRGLTRCLLVEILRAMPKVAAGRLIQAKILDGE